MAISDCKAQNAAPEGVVNGSGQDRVLGISSPWQERGSGAGRRDLTAGGHCVRSLSWSMRKFTTPHRMCCPIMSAPGIIGFHFLIACWWNVSACGHMKKGGVGSRWLVIILRVFFAGRWLSKGRSHTTRREAALPGRFIALRRFFMRRAFFAMRLLYAGRALTTNGEAAVPRRFVWAGRSFVPGIPSCRDGSSRGDGCLEVERPSRLEKVRCRGASSCRDGPSCRDGCEELERLWRPE
jgi:hypothetical protein